MTESQPIDSSLIRTANVRRATTRVLRLVGRNIDTAANLPVALAVLTWIANTVVEFAPALTRLTVWDVILYLLAVGGGIAVIENVTLTVASLIDPDSDRDGDDLWDAAQVLTKNAVAVGEGGADYGDVCIALQASRVMPALHGLTAQLRDAYARDGDMEEASALSDTEALIRTAAESLGHRDIGK
ncbi:hypothetical protein [Streptomyces sp. NPDC004579]|uniref:hypothetical protein n=1 Tax=Streptomyces sp. NPDC004579 TaxID=3154667 RepID=UPI0033B10EFF